ncbi:Metallo-dependent hydrolase [Didymella exigua CBS 183.55]|uniref:Metallo-dependent hydrolase n=1 Tax=Didymella exigua CBS 183.55 TaxID=1150837 RepID=A0A6A5RHU9_9PLEO|nr:Metallo-dependent hydrolase [Didymella exigua CBS 183.55]KAF1927063.1 Metallo-dependent hydrolase [Didymella exigua CBS 183.55]
MTPPSTGNSESFPWHLGVYDAHCHPTDIMSNVSKIQDMKARCLTIMATRGEDQHLVLGTASQYGIKSMDPNDWSEAECIVPCFGWHPWFSHQMYISDDDDREQETLTGEAKVNHYQKVLQPSRAELSEEDLRIFNALPDPTPFSVFLSQTRKHLEEHPFALVGEVGLDRSFRIPEAWAPDLWATRSSTLTPGGREGRRLTPFRCQAAHQKEVLKRQLQLAAELGRAVSVHGVQAHGLVYESLHELWKGHEKEVLSKREKKKRGHDDATVEAEINDAADEESSGPKPYPPKICLHSYSGSVSNFKQYLNPAIPIRIFASFSTAINLGDALNEETPAGFENMIKTVPDEMLLVESDLHTAGEEMDLRLEDIVRRICKIKGWGLEEGVNILGKNWKAFVFGTA